MRCTIWWILLVFRIIIIIVRLLFIPFTAAEYYFIVVLEPGLDLVREVCDTWIILEGFQKIEKFAAMYELCSCWTEYL